MTGLPEFFKQTSDGLYDPVLPTQQAPRCGVAHVDDRVGEDAEHGPG